MSGGGSATGGTRARRAAKGGSPKAAEGTAQSGSEVHDADDASPREATATRGRRRPDGARPDGRSGRSGVRRVDLDPDTLAALEDQRDFLLRSLEDLERENAAGDVDDVDYASLKDDYTARAASVLKTIESRKAAMRSARGPRRWTVIVAVVGLVAALGIGAGWLVAVSSGQRQAGDTISGDVRASSIDELAKASDFTAQATSAQQAGNSDAAVKAYQNALDSYRKVLDQQPDNVEALTYRGWLLHVLALQASSDVAQQLDGEAMTSLDKAITVDSTYPDARIFRAVIYQRQGRNTDAAADLAAVDPARVPPGMSNLVDTLKAQVQPGG